MFYSLYKETCVFVNEYFSGVFKGMNLEWSRDLEEAIDFLNLGLKPREIMVFAWFTGLVLFALTFFATLIAVLMGFEPLYIMLGGLVASILGLYFIEQYPIRMVSFERIRCLGYAPRLVAYIIIPLKQDQNLEKAIKFAAETGDDKLTEDLKKLVWGTWSGKHNSLDDALPELGHKWGGHIKGFRDALYAIRSSQLEKHESRRLDTLDRALRDLLANIQVKFKEFTNELRAPTVFLFMAGVLIPMVVLMFLPVLSLMGFDLGKPLPVFVMLCCIILAVFVISELILSKRPISFTAIRIPDDYPGLVSHGKIRIGEREMSLAKLSIFVMLIVSSPSIPYLLGFKGGLIEELNTLPILAGVFLALTVYYRFDSLPKVKAREDILRAEEESIEASFHIGNRMLSAMPAEEALIRVSELLKAPDKNKKNTSRLSEVLEKTVRNIRYSNMNFRDAFFHAERGSLKDVHSGLISGIFRLFVSSLERGVGAAAETLINTANHFREIRKVEEDLREKMSYTTSMMKISVTYVAPALCAMSVPLTETFIAMFQEMSGGFSLLGTSGMGSSLLKMPELTPPIMILILGFYMISLTLVLIRFTTMLEYGEDEVKIKHEISKALPRSLLTFVVVFFLSRMFFSQML